MKRSGKDLNGEVFSFLMVYLQLFQKPRGFVELVDEIVSVRSGLGRLSPGSRLVVPESVQLFYGLALLFHPGVVLEVVDALPIAVAELQHAIGLFSQDVGMEVDGGFFVCIFSVAGSHFLDPGTIHGS